MLPDGTNNPASRPKISAARACKPIHGRIFEINIVADFRLGHRPAHCRRRLCNRVAAKVDNFITHDLL